MSIIFSLSELGWRPFFRQQLTFEEWESSQPARIIAVHRSNLDVAIDGQTIVIPVIPSMPSLAVGDWILIENNGFQRLLERQSLFSRKAAGSKVSEQLIAANLDTAFIVCSMNQDFNLNRIERYLALVAEAEVEPVIVLTKQDLCPDAEHFIDQVRSIDSTLQILGVNSLDSESLSILHPWCSPGRTVALIGSSGVGKSTLVNGLLGQSQQVTGNIREDDSKGRHTTTGRSLHLTSAGALLLDTPGMREVQLAHCESGVEATFAEITELSEQCQFHDCQHQSEPGCAVKAAILTGKIDQRRLDSYRKLLREQAMNSASLAEKRSQNKAYTRHIKSVAKSSKRLKQNWE
ncbi:ribosome small subunit-dependent GTPase A [Endozoicomonas numazuensis]|uniref:Small ribosomal subunit biogenesis GTPase RsgA n=1 Tax=Endozoicomonas numazuensis TaxID=1137799 RepID=A0A081NGU9_9GAMM|nr:ribosome small subunit-dependent GTPase A [Endozoicomonas numazuensis]KEQ17672.1 GTPase RsgA [Endozoicomonas numazuensis]